MPQKNEKPLVIIGAGGLGKEYAWVAEEMSHAPNDSSRPGTVWKVLGFADDNPQKRGQMMGGLEIYGTIREIATRLDGKATGFAVAVGDNRLRERLALEAEAMGWKPETLMHPSAIIANGVEIGEGSYLAPGTVICPGARIGRHVVINTHVSIGHDSTLMDFAQICPGGRVSGGCRVEKSAFLGSNASLAPGIAVGEGAVVAANSFVLRKVRPGKTVLGCPALEIGKTRE